MAFKIPNFSKQMGGSPFHKKGSPLHDAKFNTTLYGGRSGGTTDRHREIEAEVDAAENEPIAPPVEVIEAEPQATIWNSELEELAAKRNGLERGSNEYNIVQNRINELSGVSKRYPVDEVEEIVENPDNVEALDIAVDPTQHVPAEGIQVRSRKQKRAARRVARLRAKARNKGGLTEGQSKRLSRNISKATGEDVAYADKTKVGQFLKGKPVDDTEFTAANMDPYGDDDPFEV